MTLRSTFATMPAGSAGPGRHGGCSTVVSRHPDLGGFPPRPAAITCEAWRMIIVGIDGSDGAQAALRFAADEATLRQTELRVVSAWHVPSGVYMPPSYMGLDLDAFRQTTSEIAEQQVVDVLEAERAPAVDVVIHEGSPAEVLIAESR